MWSTPAARRAISPNVVTLRAGSASPQMIWTGNAAAEQADVEVTLGPSQLEAPHDLQEGAAVVGAAEQDEVGVELSVRILLRSAIPWWRISHRKVGWLSSKRYASPSPFTAERLHHPRAMKGVDLDWRVQHRERGDSARMRGCKLEPHRRSDIVHQMEPVDVEGFDRGGCEPAKAGPGVVEGRGRSASPNPGRSKAVPRRPRAASSTMSLRYRNDDAGTPCRHTTG